MSDLDLTHVFTPSAVNLDWLNVDPEEYRRLDTLPHQCFDTVPELVAQWSHEDYDPLTYFVPNHDPRGYIPRDGFGSLGFPGSTGVANRATGGFAGNSIPQGDLLRTARFALMQSDDTRRWQETLVSKFSRDEIAAHREVLASLLEERGLLGRLYIAAKDFPGCADTAEPEIFVRRHASNAKFVISKKACGDCCHKQSLLSGGSRCGIFHKELVPDVGYSEALATRVEAEQGMLGPDAATLSDPKSRIKAAFLATRGSTSTVFSGQDNLGALIPASRLLRKTADTSKQARAVAAAQARPVVETLRRELLKGRSVDEITHGMRLAFDVRDLRATQSHWAPLIKEAGLYGTIYSTQDSFDDCREGADFLSKHGSKVRGIVAGPKCPSCIFSKVGRCLMYGRKLVAKVDDLYTPETVAAVLDEHQMAGSLPVVATRRDWGARPREALQAIHKAASAPLPMAVDAARLTIQRAFRGLQQEHETGTLTRREITKAASRFMNEGLYGTDLQTAMQSKFDPRDLLAASPELKPLVANSQGLQGIYFVDPTVYDDYGKGCKEAQRLHRSRQSVRYATVGAKCGSCIHQTRPGVCSVLDKRLAAEPPYQDKLAQQRAILASGNATAPLDYGSLINNGLTMMQEFELKGAGNLKLNPSGMSFEAAIQFGHNDVNLVGA